MDKITRLFVVVILGITIFIFLSGASCGWVRVLAVVAYRLRRIQIVEDRELVEQVYRECHEYEYEEDALMFREDDEDEPSAAEDEKGYNPQSDPNDDRGNTTDNSENDEDAECDDKEV